MSTKIVTISPNGAAAAGCTATCESYYSGSKPDSGSIGGTMHFTNFQATAVAARGWSFVRWNVTHRYTYSDASPPREETIKYRRYNPFPATTTATDIENPFEYEYTGDNTYPVYTRKDEIVGVEAVFEAAPVPDPTDLLVNSASRSSPVQLVYDPATDLLVADF